MYRLILIFVLTTTVFSGICCAEQMALKEPITVNGDKVEYDPEEKVMVGTGNVEVLYEGMALYADKITVWLDEQQALAQGNVRLVRDETTFYGEEISYYFEENKGKIIEPSFEKHGPWYGKGVEAEEYEKSKYLIKKAYITTCDLEEPHYKLQAKTVKAYIGDKIIAKNVIFYVRNIPLLYLPYLKYSLKDKKMPFMIIPGNNDDWGWYLLNSYRYYLNDNSKGRIRLDYREKKGIAHGVDHEYKTAFGDGIIKYYYMNEKDSEFSDNDRFKVNFRHHWQPDSATSIYTEYNKMSDIDFLKDYFYEKEYEKDPDPQTYFYLIRRLPYATLNLNINKRANHFFTEVERLPEVGMDISDLRIKDSNFYYSSQVYFSNLTNKTANSDSDDDVWRFDTYNEFSHAKRYFGFLNFSPYIGIRQTFFSKNIDGDEHKIRGAFYTGFDTSTKLYKVGVPKGEKFLFAEANAYRHTITPILRYSYVAEPTMLRTTLMQFDEIDEIDKKNKITLALENLWQIKTGEGDDVKKRDILSFDASADYDFKIAGGSKWGEATLESAYMPLDWLGFTSEAKYDLHPGYFNTASLDMVLNQDRWQLGIGQRYERDTSSQTTAEFKYRINEKWQFRVYQRYDFQNSCSERQELTIYRDLHCWDAKFSFVNNRLDGNKSFFVVFTIKAFPQHPFRFSQSYNPPGS
ncbi:MAG: LptA/OstA family protein [Candidatus Saelkia tenebricola]|nr:LptA/OstA family protein [Candidatus Saelkia tenebricola]